ncbi:hypothetical protein ACN42_g140 [Penicillium freii]|uniref:Uncharacterized protein n=1 Tax=Penicillium freii TaxID=48697 RepID=A0A117NT14_PENFR|nr:hypothetical protein ACN42_g140 [Penicillium freii]
MQTFKEKDHNTKKKKRRREKQDLSFPASAMAFPDRRGVGTQRTKDRLIFHNFTFSYRYFFWNILQDHFVLVFDDLLSIA